MYGAPRQRTLAAGRAAVNVPLAIGRRFV